MLKNKMTILVVLFSTTALCMFAYLYSQDFQQNQNWLANYDGVQVFGEHCSFAVSPYDGRTSAASLIQGKYTFKAAKMPYRKQPRDKKPKVKLGEFLYTKCSVDVSHIAKKGFVFMSLGHLTAESYVFVNKRLVLEQSEGGIAEAPLLSSDLNNPLQLDIITIKKGGQKSVGLNTMLPMFLATSRLGLMKSRRVKTYFAYERSMLYGMFVGGFLLMFIVIWLRGYRHDDISWLIIYLSIVVIAYTLYYAPSSVLPRWLQQVSYVGGMAKQSAFLCFAYAFMRKEKFKNLLPFFFIASLVIYSLLIFALPDSMRGVFGEYTYLSGLISGLISLLMAFTYKINSNLDKGRTRQLRYFKWFLLFAGVAFLIDAYLLSRRLAYMSWFLNNGMILGGSIWLLGDISKFQQKFLTTRDSIQEEKYTSKNLSETIERFSYLHSFLMDTCESGERFKWEITLQDKEFDLNQKTFRFMLKGEDESLLYFVGLADDIVFSYTINSILSGFFSSQMTSSNDLSVKLNELNETIYHLYNGHLSSELCIVEIKKGSSQIMSFDHALGVNASLKIKHLNLSKKYQYSIVLKDGCLAVLEGKKEEVETSGILLTLSSAE